jgi:uncharacterized membrane protein YeaQ/YmgE (transglycosylase-associated protein family)
MGIHCRSGCGHHRQGADAGKEAMGFIITAILGIAGSFLSTYVGEKLGWWGETGMVHFLGSIGGAVILLVIYHMLFRRNAST